MNLDRAGIEALLPHREPFLFLDRCEAVEPGRRGVAYRAVSADEPWAAGHFPGEPILPGVLLAEAMAQAAAVVALSAMTSAQRKPVYLVGFDKMRFRRPVRPGDELRIEVEVADARRRLWTFHAVATVGGEKVADGTFLATAPEAS
jgi:3-hydroxyacyl-[acyl-carrier-protein] dehydratase